MAFNPNQPADDTLAVARISDLNSKTIGIIINYACHPTTLAWDNSLASPDFVGAARDLIESKHDAPVLFCKVLRETLHLVMVSQEIREWRIRMGEFWDLPLCR